MTELSEDEQIVKYLYNNVQSAWPQNNAWYDYTQKKIIDFISSNVKDTNGKKVLNAGSGGTTYNLECDMYHVDLAEKLINKFPKHFVSSIEKMPFSNSFFDIAICVGSVINYNSAFEDILEISRVLSPSSILILEYERSLTGELLFKSGYGKGTTMQIYNYNNQNNHKLWLYSDKYIDNILLLNGLSIEKCEFFHCVSSVCNRILNDENKAGKYAALDKKIPQKIAKYIAHNKILLCKKNNINLF